MNGYLYWSHAKFFTCQCSTLLAVHCYCMSLVFVIQLTFLENYISITICTAMTINHTKNHLMVAIIYGANNDWFPTIKHNYLGNVVIKSDFTSYFLANLSVDIYDLGLWWFNELPIHNAKSMWLVPQIAKT